MDPLRKKVLFLVALLNIQAQLQVVLSCAVLCTQVMLLLANVKCDAETAVNEAAQEYYRPPGIPTTIFTGSRGFEEIRIRLFQDPQYCLDTTRLHPTILQALVDQLRAYGIRSTRISALEKVVIFLDYCAHRKTYRQLRGTYQHSLLTFTRYIKDVSRALVHLLIETIQDKPDLSHVPEIIECDGKYQPFRGCLGALDGTYIPVSCSRHEENRTSINFADWRCREGFHAQNVLFVCDLELNFVFVQSGFEGSAHDSTVLRRACENGFKVPEGRYYLADAGYSNRDKKLLVPYKKTLYHLPEQGVANVQPRNREELFNLRHAELRNCIERLNGVMKKRWQVLEKGATFGFGMLQQARFVASLCGLHNFTQKYGQPIADDEARLSDGRIEAINATTDFENNHEEESVNAFRDNIAEELWQNYINHGL